MFCICHRRGITITATLCQAILLIAGARSIIRHEYNQFLEGTTGSMILAQISDCHVTDDARHPHNLQLQDAVETINAFGTRPDIALITGDIVAGAEDNINHGEYEQAAIILNRLKIPFYVIPGNHDDPIVLHDTFSDQSALHSGFMQYDLFIDDIRIIALDTTLAHETYGLLCEKRLQWLSSKLAEDTESPTVIIMHHPPYESGMLYMDRLRCFSGPDLASIISPEPEYRTRVVWPLSPAIIYLVWRNNCQHSTFDSLSFYA